jgi:hypothetical protein
VQQHGRNAPSIARLPREGRVPRRNFTLFERRLCRRNPVVGEASEGAVWAPSE